MSKLYSEVAKKPLTMIAFSIIGFLLAYLLFTRAVDTGSLGQYGLMILIAGMSIYLIVKAIRMRNNGSKV